MSDEKPSTELTLIERAQRAEFKPGGVVQALMPQTFDAVWTLAEMLVAAGMAPPDMTAPKCTIAIMTGMEIGLPPLAAVQSISVVGNRTQVWGDAALALVISSGKLEYLKEWIVGDGDAMTAHCELKRKGDMYPKTNKFSMADAKRAGLLDKTKTPWATYPQRMLPMRARSWPLRDAFADILKGLSIRDQGDDVDQTEHDVQTTRRAVAKSDLAGKLAEGKAAVAAIENKPSVPLENRPVMTQTVEVDQDRVRPSAPIHSVAAMHTKPAAPVTPAAPPVEQKPVSSAKEQMAYFLTGCQQATSNDELEAVRSGHINFLSTLPDDEQEAAAKAFGIAQARINATAEAFSSQENWDKAEDGGEVVWADPEQEDQAQDEAKVTSEVQAEQPAAAQQAPAVTAEAAPAAPTPHTIGPDGIPDGDWDRLERIFLMKARERYAAVDTMVKFRDAEDYDKGVLALKRAPVKDAYGIIRDTRHAEISAARAKL